ncbi:protein-lysine N-methyltransferase EEF2KMT isoform X1 [Hippocampus comes]|uniref:Eukaryotic elongation factor 2 lysine methyltransferase n=1 Tax=Hippocampus comes TaxID=109280 RepID=A0A3Q3DUW1_HIPCM|nr:PREDICTED: protein-lysine N-methyltransferase EEF2KMT isoform X1 [Hippocampus comes]
MEPVVSTNFHSRKQNRSDILKQFQSRYFATSRLVSFPWTLLENELERSSSSDIILEILKQTCLHALCRKFPPSPRYRKCFLSELIKRVEAAECEPLDELYDALAEVVAAQDVAEGYRTYLLPCGNSVSLLENVALISEGTTGLVTWEAALYLAEWALDHAQIFAGRKVLELGSGAGLTGVAVCHSCAPSSYVFSDCHQSVLQRLRDNLSINGLLNNKANTSRTEVRVQDLDWTDVTEERLNDIGADVVIAADVVYDPDVIAVLVQLLSKILKRGGVRVPSEVFVCSTVRNPQTYTGFRHSLSAAGIGHRVMSGAVNHVFEYNRESEIELVQLFACQ